jgi:hypothetical protein
VNGFDVHAGVTIRAGDRAGLSHLCRYAARAPLALERLSLLEDGRVAYRLRKPRRNSATHLVMTPIELLAKIASLVPPPKRPLLRLSGVLGSGSPWKAHACGAEARTAGAEDKIRRRACSPPPSSRKPPAPRMRRGWWRAATRW